MSPSVESPLSSPPFSAGVRFVGCFAELVETPFADGVNALCWPRQIPAGFAEVVDLLGPGEGILTVSDSELRRLPVTAAARSAIALLLEDQRLLRDRDRDPLLNIIHSSPRDERGGPIATDVFSFHADRASVETDTWLCTYHGPSSEGLPNAHAQRRVDLPETRAALLADYGGDDDAHFREWLSENSYDLHYAPRPHAAPFTFGLGNLWRIAVDWPGNPVPPCIHRAPETRPGQRRLLLIS